jgi:REP element-mobilizing transposase RayT
MTRARQELISLSDTPWYHLVNRCVRRAFLCGVDSISGQNYEHRREWIEQTMLKLASVFAVDIAAFAVMSNHYHLVVRVDKERGQAWSDDEVLERWMRLFSGPVYLQRYLEDPATAEPAIAKQVQQLTQTYRERLHDLSWYMRVLNESIARMANKEDGVKGRFWEGRFKSQALLDEQAILSVMAYVDLNPIRANIADDLADSDFTSIQRRIEQTQGVKKPQTSMLQSPLFEHLSDESQSFFNKLDTLPNAPLMKFEPKHHPTHPNPVIAFEYADYLEFVDYLGRAVHPNKRGHIAESTPKIMQQLNLNESLIDTFCQGKLLKSFGSAIGNPTDLNQHRESSRAHKGQGLAKQVFA